jgi:HEAT repeat protein
MECLQALVQAGEGAVPILVEALKTGSNHHRAFAARALGLIADPSSRPALLEALKEEDELVRCHTLLALVRFGRQEARPGFQHGAEKDPHDDVRFPMAFALTRDAKPDPKRIRQGLIESSRPDLARLVVMRSYGSPFSLPSR